MGPGGAPAFFDNAEELQQKIEEYFECSPDKPTQTITITGLAYHLGFESRQSFYDYEKREQFSYVIKRARLRVESMYEAKIQGPNPAGPIFALKNMGWSDKQEIDHTTQGEKIQALNYTGISDAALREIAGLDKSKGGTD